MLVSKKFVVGGSCAALVAGALAAPAAVAEEVPVGAGGGVPVTVEVEDVDSGALWMTVDTSTAVVLAEVTGDPGNRTFEGALPTVTVTDTRTEVPEEGGWSVVGQATDFVHAEDASATISNEYLGWSPSFVDEPVGNDGVAGVGEPVSSVEEGGSGLVTGVDLLVFAFPSAGAQAVSQDWQATADLRLAVPADEVEAGRYDGTLTLSLFEY